MLGQAAAKLGEYFLLQIRNHASFHASLTYSSQYINYNRDILLHTLW